MSQKSLGALGVLLVGIGIAPIAIAIATQLLGDAFGCSTNASGANPCLIGGVDIGDALYTGFMMGFLTILTAPVFIAGAALLIFVGVRGLIGFVRR
ncbi:MAG: hypothetical protein ACKVOP_05200 [Sphingomonadaceae bacterium]